MRSSIRERTDWKKVGRARAVADFIINRSLVVGHRSAWVEAKKIYGWMLSDADVRWYVKEMVRYEKEV